MTISLQMSQSYALCVPPTRNIYLTPDERYQVWVVKAAERPELLVLFHFEQEQEKDDASNDMQSHGDAVINLQDGCDIPGWRYWEVVKCNTAIVDLLQIGAGCALTRRETQLPVIQPSSSWMKLKKQLLQPPSNSTTVRIDSKEYQESHPWFERENVPAVITGCCDEWNSMESFLFESLVDRFGAMQWRFSDTHGETMTLDAYKKYCFSHEGLADDAPLAVYDSQFGYDERATLLNDYTIPKCFNADLFADLIDNEEERPPYRWILIGPERSGTGLHIDPVGTHAWVTLLEGVKRWVLFPPNTDLATIKMENPQMPSILWFRDHYKDALLHNPDAIELLQYPRETIYVPAGWPHLVLNMSSMTVAVTQNYASEFPSFERLYRAVNAAEPALAEKLQHKSKECRPKLFAQLKMWSRM